MNRTLSVKYNDGLLDTLGISKEQFEEEARIAIAIKIYKMGGVSTGWAADFAGVPKPLFLNKLSEYGVAQFEISAEELQQDVIVAQRHL